MYKTQHRPWRLCRSGANDKVLLFHARWTWRCEKLTPSNNKTTSLRNWGDNNLNIYIRYWPVHNHLSKLRADDEHLRWNLMHRQIRKQRSCSPKTTSQRKCPRPCCLPEISAGVLRRWTSYVNVWQKKSSSFACSLKIVKFSHLRFTFSAQSTPIDRLFSKTLCYRACTTGSHLFD